MAMPLECFCVAFALVQHVVPLCLGWPLAQLFPAAWAGGAGQSSVYLSSMSMFATQLLLGCEFWFQLV
jgi:hypothetical protein